MILLSLQMLNKNQSSADFKKLFYVFLEIRKLIFHFLITVFA